MTWSPPSDSDLAADKPAKASHARRVRDLFPSLAARESGAPWLNGIGAIALAKYGPSGLFATGGLLFAFPSGGLRGTFTVPAGVTRIEVTVVGGGGCGGDAQNTIGSAGPSAGGGGGAGAVYITVIEVQPGEVFPLTIGAGGHPTLISQYVDTSLDSFQIGDGGRTTFGVWPRIAVAGGGRRGLAGDGSGDEGKGGAGGTTVLVQGDQPIIPWVEGAAGGRALRVVPGGSGVVRSGRGARSLLGAGGESRITVAGGENAPCPGAGGGGAYPGTFPGTAVGGLGASGIVILRY